MTGNGVIGYDGPSRDYVAALDERGRVLRIGDMDQDRYEATGFVYRLKERFGRELAPAFVIDRVRIGGRWIDGPVVGNLYGRWIDEAVLFGVEPVTDDVRADVPRGDGRARPAARRGRQLAAHRAGRDARTRAPRHARKSILTGDAVDLEKFAWLKNNPADVGRYVNMGAVFIQDPQIGSNVGTYRCQVKGPRKMGVNANPGQHGGLILWAMRQRGDKIAKVAVAVAPDPMTFCASSTKMAGYLEDELEFAGGLRGKPLEVVKCEHSDIRVPAHSEIVIEGDVPLTEFEEEGPYGEMYGYLGPKKPQNYFMNITAITHRKNPWVLNSFTGLTGDMPKAPQVASSFFRYKRLIPSLTAFGSPGDAHGITVISIRKRFPGEGMSAGQYVAADPGLNKVVIVVDDDVDVLDAAEVLRAIGSRWQPNASLLIPRTQMHMPDPSRLVRGLSSKMVIDATRQLPGEGGPASWAPTNHELLLKGAPGVFDLVDERWPEYMKGRRK